MKRVLKYAAYIGSNELHLPIGSEILSADEQNGGIRLWALIPDDSLDLMIRKILVYATGESVFQAELKFIDTVLLEDGRFVYHVFEVL